MGPTKKKKKEMMVMHINDSTWFLFLYTINVSQMNNSQELVCTHSLSSQDFFTEKSWIMESPGYFIHLAQLNDK